MLEKERKSTFKSLIAAYLIRGVLNLLMWTCRFKVTGVEYLHLAREKSACMVMLWHNRLVLIGPAILKVAPTQVFNAFISASQDGDIAASYTTSYRIGRVIRVPHDSKDVALKSLISRLKMKREVAIITPDGPRGPVYEVKQGVVLAAKASGAKIVPFSWTADRYWELKSWDKFRIPKPFSKIEGRFGEPISLEESEDPAKSCARLTKALQEIS